MHVSVAILRVQDGLDYTGIIADVEGKSKLTGVDNDGFTEDDATNNNDTNANQDESIDLNPVDLQ